MNNKYCQIVFLLFISLFSLSSFAVEPLPDNLIDLTSKAGQVLFKRDLNTNAMKLLSHFTTQRTTTYCGVASAVMILNSTSILQPADSAQNPYHYFNQDNFFNEKVQKIIPLTEVSKSGITLTKLSEAIQSYGLESKPYFADKLNLDEFRSILKNALLHQQFIIVNFLRTELQQKGGGHHSPIAAYDKQTDRFLLLDVARFKYPSYWVKTADLWKAVDTIDNGTSRGFIIIS
jgi:hypothetical protein